tara:strand:- start:1328 stop:1867 length:540 start_codon:yes stop_codon:yes gene_type:complete
MIIDKSHSKKDIVLVFKKLNVTIDDKLTKGNIVSNIEDYFENAVYNDKIKNCTELKELLKNPSKKQRPTRQEKKEIMFNSKKIIKWAKNNYRFDNITYQNDNQPYNDIMSIYMWGDLPSVRKACRYYNLSVYCKDNVNPIITEEIEEEMNMKKIIKKEYIYSLEIKHKPKENPFIVRFD